MFIAPKKKQALKRYAVKKCSACSKNKKAITMKK